MTCSTSLFSNFYSRKNWFYYRFFLVKHGSMGIRGGINSSGSLGTLRTPPDKEGSVGKKTCRLLETILRIKPFTCSYIQCNFVSFKNQIHSFKFYSFVNNLAKILWVCSIQRANKSYLKAKFHQISQNFKIMQKPCCWSQCFEILHEKNVRLFAFRQN